ncbi:MAG: hypothetical protein GC136_04575 [Alphaproteobacteria bacterium]|nr:hypothetical protein [Alphaproteobacteria bacterium]
MLSRWETYSDIVTVLAFEADVSAVHYRHEDGREGYTGTGLFPHDLEVGQQYKGQFSRDDDTPYCSFEKQR